MQCAHLRGACCEWRRYVSQMRIRYLASSFLVLSLSPTFLSADAMPVGVYIWSVRLYVVENVDDRLACMAGVELG